MAKTQTKTKSGKKSPAKPSKQEAAPESSGATRLTDLAQGRQDVVLLDPRTIVVDEGFNYRNFKLPSNKAHLKDIRSSIAEVGITTPLWVRFDSGDGLPHLIAGETRLRGVLELLDDPTLSEEALARIRAIPAIQKSGTKEELLLLSLLENTQKPPSKWEVGLAYQRLLEGGMTVKDLAKAMGQSPKYIQEALELKDAPEEIKQMMASMTVTPSHYLWTVKRHGKDGAKVVLGDQLKKAKEQVEKKQKEKAEREAAAEKGGGKKSKGGRPATKVPVVKLTRPKAAGGMFIPDETLKTILGALKAAKKSEDVGISTTAEAAFDALTNLKKAKSE